MDSDYIITCNFNQKDYLSHFRDIHASGGKEIKGEKGGGRITKNYKYAKIKITPKFPPIPGEVCNSFKEISPYGSCARQ